MEEANEGREVGVVGGGVGMEERTGMEGRIGKGEKWKQETKLCCFLDQFEGHVKTKNPY